MGEWQIAEKINTTDQNTRLKPVSISASKFQQTLELITGTEVIILISFLITTGLVILSVLHKDGPALPALVFLSLQSVSCSYILRATAWDSDNGCESTTHNVIIKTQENAFWVIVCDSMSLRALLEGNFGRLDSYWKPGSFRFYRNSHMYFTDAFRESGIVVAFVLFGTAKFVDQVAIAAAYMFLTIIFWIVQPPGVAPYEVTTSPLYHPHAFSSRLANHDLRKTEVQPSLAKTIWYLLRITRSTGWAHSIQVIPEEGGWDERLEAAIKNMFVSDWPAEAEKHWLVDADVHVYDEEPDVAQEAGGESTEIQPVPASQW